MPFSAVTLKSDHRGGFSTSIADSIYSSATVGDSPVLSVDNSIGNSSVGHSFRPFSMLANRLICSTSGKISEVQKFVENNFKILSAMRRQRTRHIFPNDKARIPSACGRQHFPDDPDCFIEQAASVAAQSFALSRNAQVLARRAEGDDVHRLDLTAFDVRYAAEVLHLRQVCFGNGNRVRLHFACPHSPPAAHHSTQWHGPASIEQAAQLHLRRRLPQFSESILDEEQGIRQGHSVTPHGILRRRTVQLVVPSLHCGIASGSIRPGNDLLRFLPFDLAVSQVHFPPELDFFCICQRCDLARPSGKPCSRPHSIGSRRRTTHSGRRGTSG